MNPDEPKGQILPESDFGKLLTELACSAEIIVEIGCWHGQGTTRCLANGLKRDTQRMISIDASAEMVAEAMLSYHDFRMRFVWGEIRPMDQIGSCPNLLDWMPARIDLLVLDGGDETGYRDFCLLKDRSNTIALDDCTPPHIKNSQARLDLLKDGWFVIKDAPQERNGWFVAKRRP